MNVARPVPAVALDMQFTVGTATGVGVYARDLFEALAHAGVDARALRWAALDPWRFDRRILWDQVVLPLALARSGARVFHATAGTLPALRNVPTVVTVHDMAWQRVQAHTRPYARAYFGALMRRLYRTATAVVTDSAFSRDEYCELTGDSRPVTIVEPGVDARFAAIERRPDRRPFALVVGTVERRKMLARTIAIAAAIPELHIVSVGPPTPYLAEVQREATAAGIADRLEIRGYVAQAELDDLYARATLALVPSDYEGFGYAVAEARCAGVPFVATRGSSLVEVAGEAGMLVAPDDCDAWIESVRAVVRDPAWAQAHADAGRAAAIARFSWTRAARDCAALYARVAR